MIGTKNKLYDIFEYMFVIFTILQGNSVYEGHNSKLVIIIWELLAVSLWVYSNSLNKHKYKFVDKEYLLIFMFMMLSFIILIFYYLFYSFSLGGFLLWCINPTLLLYYFCNISTNNYSFFRKYEFVMYILALISILCYLIYYFTRYSGGLTINYKWGSGQVYNAVGYLGLWFHPQFVGSGYNFLGMTFPIRNTSIFVEAPVYAYLLSIAVFINVFLIRNRTKKSNFHLIILFIAIILTFSTNGIILSIAAIFIKGIKHPDRMKRCLYIITIPIALIICKIIFDNKKYSNINNIYSSYNIRHNDMIASLHAWLNHIIFGNGINNNNAIYSYISNTVKDYLNNGLTGTAGITSDFFAVLAYGGIVLALFYIIPTILSLNFSHGFRDIILFMFAYFLFEGVMSYYIYTIFLSFCIAKYMNEKFRKKLN